MSRSPVSRRGRLRPSAVPVAFEGPLREVPPSDRVAFVASYSADATVTRSLDRLIGELKACGYPVILVRASDDEAPLDWPGDDRDDVVVIRKPNLGYDFGSWAVGMAWFPHLLSRDYVLLVNDSLVGPFAPLAPIIEDFESSICDVWGVTGTTQFIPHLQSYFLGFKNASLADPALRAFWRSLPVETDKLAMVDSYELGLTRLLFAEAFVSTAMFQPERVVAQGQNPTINGWRRLIDLGFPFVKRAIVTDSGVALNGSAVEMTMRDRFGESLHDWL